MGDVKESGARNNMFPHIGSLPWSHPNGHTHMVTHSWPLLQFRICFAPPTHQDDLGETRLSRILRRSYRPARSLGPWSSSSSGTHPGCQA